MGLIIEGKILWKFWKKIPKWFYVIAIIILIIFLNIIVDGNKGNGDWQDLKEEAKEYTLDDFPIIKMKMEDFL